MVLTNTVLTFNGEKSKAAVFWEETGAGHINRFFSIQTQIVLPTKFLTIFYIHRGGLAWAKLKLPVPYNVTVFRDSSLQRQVKMRSLG